MFDLARILRLPGTPNRKNQRNGKQPVPCTMVKCDGALRYSFETFERFAAKSPSRLEREKIARVPLPKPRAKIGLSKSSRLDGLVTVCDAAEKGARSHADFALLCYAVENGVSPEEIWARVENIGKFAEAGHSYFLRSWENAENHYRRSTFEKAKDKGSSSTSTKSTSTARAMTARAIAADPSIAQDSTAVAMEALVEALGDDDGDLLQKRSRTERANAKRLVAKFGKDFRYCTDWEATLVWTGQRWTLDKAMKTGAFAKDIADGLWDEIASLGTESEGQEIDDDLIAAIERFAAASSSAMGLNNMARLSRNEPGIPISSSELDQHPFLFNVANGTICLKTGELRKHSRDDLLTMLSPVHYDPEAQCPLWLDALNKIFQNNQLMVDFYQQFFGSALIGQTCEQVLPFFHGNGANGKTMTCETMLAVFGDYGLKASSDLLIAKKGETHPTEKADLFGKRLVLVSETGSGKYLNESLAKELTGNDTIRARRMRENFWSFKPSHTAVVLTNHKPRIKGTDEGIWRRIRLVPFLTKFWNPDLGESGPEELRAEKGIGALLQEELSGILAWAVRGCLIWQKEGLLVPPEIADATQEYRLAEDTIGNYVEERCFRGNTYQVRAKFIREDYKQWCFSCNERPVGQKRFWEWLNANKVTRRLSNGVVYEGIGLKSDW
ncbi:MAG TPA: phage/plasmid primase, P4 family [Pirellulales bacterium]